MNDLVTRRGREIFLLLGELDKQLLREEPAHPHAALSLPLLIGLLDRLISRCTPLRISAKECSRSKWWQNSGGQPAPQPQLLKSLDGRTLSHHYAHTHIKTDTHILIIHLCRHSWFLPNRVSQLWNFCDWCVFAPVGLYIWVWVGHSASYFLPCKLQNILYMDAQIVKLWVSKYPFWPIADSYLFCYLQCSPFCFNETKSINYTWNQSFEVFHPLNSTIHYKVTHQMYLTMFSKIQQINISRHHQCHVICR